MATTAATWTREALAAAPQTYFDAVDAMDIDAFGFWEDMGYNHAPLISPAMARQFMHWGAAPAAMVGHSLGATLSIAYAEKHGEQIGGVVNYVNQTFRLFKAAEALRPAKLLTPKVKG